MGITGDDSEDTAGKLVLGFGCGCLVLVLLAGVLGTAMIAGGGMACQNSAERGMKAEMAPVQALLDKVGAGQIAEAYDAMGDQYRATQTRGAFQDVVTGHRGLFAGGEARFAGTRRRSKGYYLMVQILDEGGTEKGLATFWMTTMPGGARVIDGLFAGVPKARIAEDFARGHLQNHVALLARGDVDAAFASLDAGVMDRQTFGVFVESQAGLFEGARARIVRFEGKGRDAEALVEIVGSDDAVRAQVRYRLVLKDKEAWKIVSIETMQEGMP